MIKNDVLNILEKDFGIEEKYVEFVDECEKEIAEKFENLDRIREYNTYKVLSAFKKNRLSSIDFYWTTGYGYGDYGRDKVESIYSDIFHTEDALVRPSIASGTHAINLVLSGILKQNDEFIEISGRPYDTLMDIIGVNEDNEGSLIDRGVLYREIPLVDNKIDVESVLNAVSAKTKLLAIQRSTGYSDRNALTIEEIKRAIGEIKKVYPNLDIFVDNCYGEFTDIYEPTDVGADVIAGSLIKNPGGGIAYSGGYICGKERLVKLISKRLTAPGLEKEVGLTFGTTKTTLQGLYFAPMVVNQALKGALLLGNVYKKFGYRIVPEISDKRSDIVQAIEFGDPEILKIFCESIQEASAVDSHVKPEPSEMPGYDNKIIMAAGGFVEGSSIEMSADGPLREPYFVYYQGGLSFEQIKLAIYISLKNLTEEGYINL